jgi:hypothetical protein
VGELPNEVRERVHQLTWEQLQVLSEKLQEFVGLDDLVAWLNEFERKQD